MKTCDNCGKAFEGGVSTVWRAGSEAAREDLGTHNDAAGQTVHTTRVTYTDLIDVPVDVCPDCVGKRRGQGIRTSAAFLVVGLLLVALPFSGLIGGDLRQMCGAVAFFAAILSAYAVVSLVKNLRGPGSKGFVKDLTESAASAKALEQRRGTIFPPT